MAWVAPASLPWLVLHDLRVKARGRQGRWGRWLALAVLAVFPLVGGIMAAWQLRTVAPLPLKSLGITGAVLCGVLLVMTSSAFAHVLRMGRNRGELELLLTAPVPVARVVAARLTGVQTVVALPFLLISGPFFIASAVLGHPLWLAGMLVMLALALVATALALLLATGLERGLGPRRASAVAQATGVVMAGSMFALGQLPNFAPLWFKAQLAWLATRPLPLLDLLAQALFGQPLALGGLLLVAAGAAGFSARVAAARMEAVPADPHAPAHQRRAPPPRFGASPFAALAGKEIKLLRRDPELISQIGQQLVFMVPVLALIFTDGRITPERMASAGVFLGGALASSLAWLAICAEDAPDLIAAAPLPPGLATRAKLAAALSVPMVLVLLLALAVATRSAAAALLMVPMALVAALATTALQIWGRPPARRSSFRMRHQSSLLMAVGEFVTLGAVAAATRLMLAGSWWALAALAGAALLLAAVWIFRVKPPA